VADHPLDHLAANGSALSPAVAAIGYAVRFPFRE
jgi:hypothetical protein